VPVHVVAQRIGMLLCNYSNRSLPNTANTLISAAIECQQLAF
jgi:hypothetical protein